VLEPGLRVLLNRTKTWP